MGIFDFLRGKKNVEQKTVSKENVGEDTKKSAEPSKTKKKSEKELATERGEPYIAILSMDVDPADLLILFSFIGATKCPPYFSFKYSPNLSAIEKLASNGVSSGILDSVSASS